MGSAPRTKKNKKWIGTTAFAQSKSHPLGLRHLFGGWFYFCIKEKKANILPVNYMKRLKKKIF